MGSGMGEEDLNLLGVLCGLWLATEPTYDIFDRYPIWYGT